MCCCGSRRATPRTPAWASTPRPPRSRLCASSSTWTSRYMCFICAGWGRSSRAISGVSMITKENVSTLIGHSLSITAQLTAVAMCMTLLIAFPDGHHLGGQAQQRQRYAQPHLLAAGHLHAQLLAGFALHHLYRRGLALVSAGRVCAAGTRIRTLAERADLAGAVHRCRPRFIAVADGARQHAGCAEQRLHPAPRAPRANANAGSSSAMRCATR